MPELGGGVGGKGNLGYARKKTFFCRRCSLSWSKSTNEGKWGASICTNQIIQRYIFIFNKHIYPVYKEIENRKFSLNFEKYLWFKEIYPPTQEPPLSVRYPLSIPRLIAWRGSTGDLPSVALILLVFNPFTYFYCFLLGHKKRTINIARGTTDPWGIP